MTLEEVFKKGNFIEIGEALCAARKTAVNKRQGYGSMGDYVESLGMASSTASRYMSIYDVFVDYLSLDDDTMLEIGIDRLLIIKKACKEEPKSMVDIILEKAKDMTPKELKLYIKNLKDDDPDPNEILEKEFVRSVKARMGTIVGKKKEFCMCLIIDQMPGDQISELYHKLSANFYPKEVEGVAFEINVPESARSPF